MTLLGTHRADITPAGPVPLAGYARRANLGPTDAVLAPLRLRTFVLGEADDAPVVIVGADLLWWSDELVQALREQVHEEFGIPGHNLVLHATHTHSGPQTCRFMAPSLGHIDEDYLEQLRRTTLASIATALGNRTAVRVERGRARAEVSVNRRWARTAGHLPRTPIDQDLTAIRFVDAQGHPVAAFVHFSCHPVVHHGHAISPDFPGALTAALEDDVAPVVMYLQGACGDVNPDLYTPDGTYHDGGQPEIDRVGQALARAARGALTSATDYGPPQITLHRSGVDLPLRDRADHPQLQRLASQEDHLGEWARLMLAHPQRFTRTPRLDLVRVDLGAQIQLLGMPAEPFSLYGLHTRRVSNDRCLPLGYTDGMTTYLVGAHHHAEGGYEPLEAPYYLGMPAELSTATEGAVLAAITDLVTHGAPVPPSPRTVTNL